MSRSRIYLYIGIFFLGATVLGLYSYSEYGARKAISLFQDKMHALDEVKMLNSMGEHSSYPTLEELSRMEEGSGSEVEAQRLYLKLIEAIGISRAQDVLAKTVRDDARHHTLNHISGAFIYAHFGSDGVGRCKTYFSGSCYHGFMVALVAERGVSDLPALKSVCRALPNKSEYMLCIHGIGHGLLAYVGYERLLETLPLCRALSSNAEELFECGYGVFMENTVGFFNVPPPGRLYRADDPMYPCEMREIVSAGMHDVCWDIQSRKTLNRAYYPQLKSDADTVSRYCSTLKEKDRHTCVRNLARQLYWFSDNAAEAEGRCGAIANESYARECRWGVAKAAYYYYDHAPAVLRTCVSEVGEEKNACYENAIFSSIESRYEDSRDRIRNCAELPEPTYREMCLAWMNKAKEDNRYK